MDNNIEPQDESAGRRIESYAIWGRYALLTLALITAIFVLSTDRREESSTESDALTRVMYGDYYLKVIFFSNYIGSTLPGGAGISLQQPSLRKMVIKNYAQAAKYPVPTGIRHYGIYREYVGAGDALSELRRLTSKPALKDAEPAARTRLRDELRMWEDIYGRNEASPLSPNATTDYKSRIEKLYLGPLQPIALNRLYLASGNKSMAERVIKEGNARYASMLLVLFAMGFILLAAGIAGVGFLIAFYLNRKRLFQNAGWLTVECDGIQHPILWMSFLAYMTAFVVMSVIIGVIVNPIVKNASQSNQVLYLLLAQLAASVLSGLTGLGTLVYFSRLTGGDLCAIGLTTKDFWKNVLWGVMGYCALLPILGLAALVSNVLFKGAGGEGHPIVPMLLTGGWLSRIAVLILASVLAPFFEETFFRGVLYNALRAKMKVIPSIVLSAGAFAIIHPQLPAGFLPIFGIGVVFAVLFETRKSLVPSMVAHALNNTVVLLITILGFAS